MNAARTVLAAVLVGFVLAGCATSAGTRAAVRGVSMDRLKSLAGTWTMKDNKGQTQVAMVTSVIAGGTVVRETMFPGSDHEMVNMYHADNGTLVATHYCAGGNQPRMQAVAGTTADTYVFAFRDITNRTTADAPFMGGLTITFIDNDHVIQEWQNYKSGKPAGPAGPRFELTRAKS